jgi:gamma-glutamyl:cysteine ligase YbdK (ATP-grasp superfamily)
MNRKIGMELELNLYYRDGEQAGTVANLADLVLTDPRNTDNQGGVLFVPESSHYQIEINSNPASDITQLDDDLRLKLMALERICEDHGLFPAATSTNGSGEILSRIPPEQFAGRDPFSLSNKEVRIAAYYGLLGEKKSRLTGEISGIHIHLDQIEGSRVKQYNLLLALDPVSFALTSTSPIDGDGNNSINNQRVNSIRNVAFSNFPQLAELPKYIESVAELESRIKKGYNTWRDNSGVPTELFEKAFNLGNAGWQPIRKKDDIGEYGTWEVRSPDSAPLNLALAVVALYKGVHDYALSSGIPISISENEGEYSFHTDGFILPTHQTLKSIEEEAIHQGLKSEKVRDYVRRLLPVAELGLKEQELKYLEPIQEMIQRKGNPSDQIMSFMHQHYDASRYDPKQAAEANLFARELYVQGMN